MVRANRLVVGLPHHANRLRFCYESETFKIVLAHDSRCDKAYASAFHWYLSTTIQLLWCLLLLPASIVQMGAGVREQNKEQGV